MNVVATDTRGSGLFELRPAPAGLPSPDITPPTIAESGDPFANLRIVAYVAQLERGRPVRIDAIVDGLNARHLDWLFSQLVVSDALIALQANWMADYRNIAGFELADGDLGETLTIEDTPRVDPWIVNQALRAAAACREALLQFSRLDRASGG